MYKILEFKEKMGTLSVQKRAEGPMDNRHVTQRANRFVKKAKDWVAENDGPVFDAMG